MHAIIVVYELDEEKLKEVSKEDLAKDLTKLQDMIKERKEASKSKNEPEKKIKPAPVNIKDLKDKVNTFVRELAAGSLLKNIRIFTVDYYLPTDNLDIYALVDESGNVATLMISKINATANGESDESN